jgi:hypothetical protein
MYYATEIYNIQSTSEIILYTRKNEARQRNKATAFETPSAKVLAEYSTTRSRRGKTTANETPRSKVLVGHGGGG